MIGGRTRVFALLGQPVAHSLSPAMHNAAFRALGLDAVYVALPCAAGDVGGLMAALARAGGGGNVTVPHKEVAAAAVTRPGAAVAELGACNTFWAEGAAVAGDLTDVAGVQAAVLALGVGAGPWLVLGTGGSARAVVGAARRGAVPLAVRSRAASRASAFAAWAGLPEARGPAALVVNATPLGLRDDDPLPCPIAGLPRGAAVLDLVYRPGGTAWVRAARAAGHRAHDGREVLVRQGAAAWAHWWPGVRPPLEVMRAAVDAGLR